MLPCPCDVNHEESGFAQPVLRRAVLEAVGVAIEQQLRQAVQKCLRQSVVGGMRSVRGVNGGWVKEGTARHRREGA